MRLSTMFGLSMAASLLLTAGVMAQPGGGGGGGRGPGGGMGMFQQDPLQTLLGALGDANLRPDFTLSADQKTKLQAIRDDVKKAADKWRADNAEALKKLQADAQAARDAQDQDKMQEVMTKRRDLMQTQPKTDDAAKAVRALLTDDQAKTLDQVIAQRQEEMRGRMGMMGGGRGRRGGAGGGGGGGGN